ncbi:MAG: hypothetical protein SF066_02320 [Thermoanaerobaculia bacterium]|nr:hypothetical protein [Thermoanaerobaculia bacterium]
MSSTLRRLAPAALSLMLVVSASSATAETKPRPTRAPEVRWLLPEFLADPLATLVGWWAAITLDETPPVEDAARFGLSDLERGVTLDPNG